LSIRKEYLENPTSFLQNLSLIEKQINTIVLNKSQKLAKKVHTGKAIFNTSASSRVPSHFEAVQLRKIKSFTDHAGNYITKTGYKIDDYALLGEKQVKDMLTFKLRNLFRKTFCKDKPNSKLKGLTRAQLYEMVHKAGMFSNKLDM